MAFANGGSIVTNGLVLALDAADRNSYVSGSTIWRDVSGNGNNGTLTNGPGFDTGSISAISFNGIDNFVTMNSSTSLTTSTPTLIVACTTNNGIVLAKGGGGVYWNYGLLSLTSTSFRARNNNNDTLSPTFTASTSTYNVYAIVWTGSTMQFYRNGVYGGDNAASYSPSATNSLFLRIGCAWNNNTSQNVEFYSGKIANIQIYNRALSATEILQNYNAVKTRFGL